MGKRILSAVLILIAISLLVSCNESEIGVFYGLSHEEKVKDYALPNKSTSEGMVKTGGYLYVAASSIYRKKAEGGELDWHKISSPDGYHNCTEIGLANDTIFILAYDADDAKPYLFSGTGDGSWEKKTTPIDKKISRMRVANDVIFITDREGHLYYSDDSGSSFTQDTSIPDSKLFSTSTGNFDIAYGGGSYYLNAQYKLYKGNPGGFGTEFTPTHNGKIWKDKEDVFTRFYYDEEDDRLYTADNSGYIYAVDSPSGASKTSWVKSDSHTRSGMGLQGIIVLRVPTSSGSKHKVLMAGTGINSGRGYFMVDNPRTTKRDYLDPVPPRNREYSTIISDFYDYNAFNLSKAAINSFFIDEYADGTNFDVYALTFGYGVWKNTNKGGYERGWNQE
ncbi:MAG: hypothetical protein J6U56_01225 [Spirochaetia bacterium]|nr:hypothetical protein [Spirochaetia bacterium]